MKAEVKEGVFWVTGGTSLLYVLVEEALGKVEGNYWLIFHYERGGPWGHEFTLGKIFPGMKYNTEVERKKIRIREPR